MIAPRSSSSFFGRNERPAAMRAGTVFLGFFADGGEPDVSTDGFLAALQPADILHCCGGASDLNAAGALSQPDWPDDPACS